MSIQSPLTEGLICPAPTDGGDRIQLGHGSGGRLSANLLRERFLPRFQGAALAMLSDGAVVPVSGGEIVVSTDTFVVRPLVFPGGDIGALAVHGTVNDLAMMGAEPKYLTAGFVLEEGLRLDLLDRILDSMAAAAQESGIEVVAGDTKVVDRGMADGLYINTTGIGFLEAGFRPRPDAAAPGDRVLLSGPIGRHGIAVLAARNELDFEAEVESDTASLHGLVRRLRDAVGDAVRVLRDPTRGGVASALNEIATASGVGIELDEAALPVPGPVAAACEMLGLDPLYVANEGILVAIVRETSHERALAALRSDPIGRHATLAGRVVADHPGMVVLRTRMGAGRVVDLLSGAQLPRIC